MIYFTPASSSWLNMVERFFRDLTQNRLRRGEAAHAVIESCGRFNINLSLQKEFRLRERLNMQISAEASNLLNSAQFRPELNAGTGSTYVGSLVLPYANAHFGASIQNFYRSESQLGRANHFIEGMAAGGPPEVRKGLLKVPTGHGLGVEINPDFLKANLAAGEQYWG